MEIEVAGTFLPVLGWKSNWSPFFTSHRGGGLERVDTSIHRTGHEWYPEGAPTKRLVADLGDITIEKICFSESRQTLTSIRHSKRSSILVSKGHQANETDMLCTNRPNMISMDTERKIVVGDVQCQIIAISTVKAPWDTLKSIRVVSSITCLCFRIVGARELWNW